MSAPKVGDRVQAVLNDVARTSLPGMVGTVIPRSEWPAGMPFQWTEGNTIVVRWDRGSHGVYTPSTRGLQVLDVDDDGTEAGSLAEVSVPAFPDVLAHGRAMAS